MLDGVQTKMGLIFSRNDDGVVSLVDEEDKLPGHTPRGTAIGCCCDIVASRRNNRMNCDPIRPFPPITSINCGGCCCGMIIAAAVTIFVMATRKK